MIARKFLLMLLCGTLCLGVVSCNKDKDDVVPENCTEAEEALEEGWEKVEEAQEEYEDEDSEDNCDALKEAYQDYIDLLESNLDCPGLSDDDKEELEEQIDSLEDQLDDLCDDNGEEPEPTDCDDAEEELEVLFEEYEEAAEAYELNPTTANCAAATESLDNVINALEDFANCPGVTAEEKAQIQEYIAEMEEEKADLCESGENPGNSEICEDPESVLADELEAFSVAFEAYSANPTSQNCSNLKAAFDDYAEAALPYGECPNLTDEERETFYIDFEETHDLIYSLCE